MDARFTILASGSSGNAAFLEAHGFGLLIDCGLYPRTISARLAAIGSSWNAVHAVILTHTHGDHWKDATLARLRSGRVPLFAHAFQQDQLNTSGPSFETLHKAKLTRTYAEGQALAIAPGLTCTPIEVPHDADPTFAFRFDYRDGTGDGPAWSIGYASDLGHTPATLPDAFAGVDVLAVEYNHDEQMQRTSRRPISLIRRVLGKEGHLSNRQAAELTTHVLARSGPEFPMCLVQLHLSRECNTPALAIEAGKNAVMPFRRPVTIVTARQDVPSRSIPLQRRETNSPRITRSTLIPLPLPVSYRRVVQPSLPGFDA